MNILTVGMDSSRRTEVTLELDINYNILIPLDSIGSIEDWEDYPIEYGKIDVLLFASTKFLGTRNSFYAFNSMRLRIDRERSKRDVCPCFYAFEAYKFANENDLILAAMNFGGDPVKAKTNLLLAEMPWGGIAWSNMTNYKRYVAI